MSEKFSERQGYSRKASAIAAREHAPPELRKAIRRIAQYAGMSPKSIWHVVCGNSLWSLPQVVFHSCRLS